MASRRACFRSAAISASRSGRCWPLSSSCRSGSVRCSPSPLLALGRGRHSDRRQPLVRRPSRRARKAAAAAGPAPLPRAVVVRTLFVLIVMLFSKVLYLASLNSYYTFYLIQTFGVSLQTSQVLLFVFLASVAAGTFLGGPMVDRIGAKYVIWGSILGVLPFTLLLAASRARRHGDQFDCDRPHHLVGLLGDGRLCAGADARQCRRGRGPVLRPVVRLGRASARRCWACSPTTRA